MTKPKPKPDDAAQSARFIEAAKRAEVDKTGEGFERAFKKIVPEKRSLAVSKNDQIKPAK